MLINNFNPWILELDAELIESDSDEELDDDDIAGLSEEQRNIKIAEKQRYVRTYSRVSIRVYVYLTLLNSSQLNLTLFHCIIIHLFIWRYRDQIEQSLARKKQFEQQTKMRR